MHRLYGQLLTFVDSLQQMASNQSCSVSWHTWIIVFVSATDSWNNHIQLTHITTFHIDMIYIQLHHIIRPSFYLKNLIKKGHNLQKIAFRVMPLVLQLHLMMGTYSKFGVDIFSIFWIMGYIRVFARQQQQWSSNHNCFEFFFKTDKLKMVTSSLNDEWENP